MQYLQGLHIKKISNSAQVFLMQGSNLDADIKLRLSWGKIRPLIDVSFVSCQQHHFPFCYFWTPKILH